MNRSCHVWWARPSSAAGWHDSLFTAAERGRAAAYRRPVDAARFTVGCTLSRLALGEWLGVCPGAVPLRRDCPDCGGPHGKPRVDGDPVFVTVSHSGDWVVVALTDAGPVGVDVEAHRGGVEDLAATALDDAELHELRRAPPHERDAAFLTYWVRKEAALKATGDGLRTELRAVRVSGHRRPPRVLDYPGSPAIQLSDLDAGAGHSAALAVVTERMPDIIHHDAAAMLAAPKTRHGLGCRA